MPCQRIDRVLRHENFLRSAGPIADFVCAGRKVVLRRLAFSAEIGMNHGSLFRCQRAEQGRPFACRARSAKGPFANAFASATSALNPSNAATANQQTYNQSLANVQGKLTQWFQAAGIDTSQDIQLSLSADGTVQLANSPPDAAQIQQVLSNHPELGGMLQSLSNCL